MYADPVVWSKTLMLAYNNLGMNPFGKYTIYMPTQMKIGLDSAGSK